jgi:hypothetical protein
MTATTIHFIGILLFWTQPTTFSGIQVIVPTIIAPSTNPTTLMKQPSEFQPAKSVIKNAALKVSVGTKVENPNAPGIETHMAFIAFPTGSVLAQVGWTPAPLPELNPEGLSYIPLLNDHIRFDTSPGLNQAVTPTVKQNIPLPSVQRSCSSTKLRPEFQAPNYSGAAGVIDIAEGALNGCVAEVKDPAGVVKAVNRFDMELTLNNQGAVVIRTIDGSKMLVLAGGAKIYVANVPVSWPATLMDIAGANSVPHFQRYYEMTDAAHADQCGMLIGPSPSNFCSPQPMFVTQFGGEHHMPNSSSNQRTPDKTNNSECSNSQFP